MCVLPFASSHRAYQILVQARRCYFTTSPCSFLRRSPNAVVDKTLLERYRCLDIPQNLVQATYLWIDGTGEQIRGKDRVLSTPPNRIEDIPTWSYDGSSTYQAQGEESDMLLHPKAIYRDPFKAANNVLVMCETYHPDGTPTKWNLRHKLKESIDKTKDCEALFGIEQEYTLLGADGRPFGWPANGYPAPQGPYYCSVGASCAYGRDIVESHVLACLHAGIAFYGTNAEVLLSQWEYQVGTVDGLKVSDDIWVSRYILKRIAELYGIDVTFDPKPMAGNWNGSGAHTNFSTKAMRENGGLEVIKEAMCKLEKRHSDHIAVYDPNGGKDNLRRLHGILETSDISKFTWGIGSRGVSARIPKPVAIEGKGYLEDRRPAANCDPYAVCNALIRTCLLDE